MYRARSRVLAHVREYTWLDVQVGTECPCKDWHHGVGPGESPLFSLACGSRADAVICTICECIFPS